MTTHPRPRLTRLLTALAAPTLLVAALTGPALAAPGDDAVDTDPALTQTVSADEAVATGPAVIDAGHVDLGPRVVDGKWTVQLRDDSGDHPVWRDPDEVVLHVTDAALMDAPTDDAYSFLGASAGDRYYVVPQTQDPAVVWLGWNTQDPGVTQLVDRGATMSIGPVSGPGKSWMFLQNGTFGEPLLLVDGQKDAAQDVWVDVNTHVHANWVFTTPGIYLARLTFSADTVTGGHETASTTLRFAVGTSTSTEDTLAATLPTPDHATGDVPADGTGSGTGDGAADATTDGAAGQATSSTLGPLTWALAGAAGFALLLLVTVLVRRSRATARDRAAAIAQVHHDAPGGRGE